VFCAREHAFALTALHPQGDRQRNFFRIGAERSRSDYWILRLDVDVAIGRIDPVYAQRTSFEGGYPGANPTDTEFFAAKPKFDHARFTAFGMTRPDCRRAARTVELALFRGLRVTPTIEVDPTDGSLRFTFRGGRRKTDIDDTKMQ